MSASTDEFRDIINAEMLVDMEKLGFAAQHGIPDEVRGEVWKYLLGVYSADKASEMPSIKAKAEEYSRLTKDKSEVINRVRGEASRYVKSRSKYFKSQDYILTIENVLTTFLNHHRHIDYSPALVHFCGPLVYSMSAEAEVYYSLEKIVQSLDDHLAQHSISERLSNFITLFRTLLPDLYNHFEEEEVDHKTWARSWFENLLAKELPFECVLRLWDTYFSVPDGFQMHVYVCLAILYQCKENLEELEQSEIHSLLLRLPALDIDQIVSQANQIKYEVMERCLSDLTS
ncbi:rab-GTPase-TBC domain-containing protein [Polychytrium aggregatum]|uniref:rab-GTPase-TBC domain-containing protein n=1 Tax=Polychytrium aggregatum TaxID=110093 RepID=UPI0022FDB0AA|nr:rab-GTPase-TBC domain-containing protein [Polychytrium aggregatum]KAI9203968.1 rab-GTPase-TBC domain-containing protein [Polychytrium aggregatum]